MAPIRREILDPRTEEDIIVREIPFERADGTVSKRLKVWVFENAAGKEVGWIEVHRTANLGAPTEVELEELYMSALLNQP